MSNGIPAVHQTKAAYRPPVTSVGREENKPNSIPKVPDRIAAENGDGQFLL